jgi:hypothetical protein
MDTGVSRIDKVTQRTTIKSTLGVLAGASAAQPAGKAGIKFAFMLGVKPDHKTRIGRQIGLSYGIHGCRHGAQQGPPE